MSRHPIFSSGFLQWQMGGIFQDPILPILTVGLAAQRVDNMQLSFLGSMIFRGDRRGEVIAIKGWIQECRGPGSDKADKD